MRTSHAVVAVVCLSIGFGAGLLTFKSPFDNSHRGDVTETQVEAAVTARATGDISFTSCSKLASPPDTWTCQAFEDLGGGTVFPQDFRATVIGSSIHVQRR